MNLVTFMVIMYILFGIATIAATLYISLKYSVSKEPPPDLLEEHPELVEKPDSGVLYITQKNKKGSDDYAKKSK